MYIHHGWLLEAVDPTRRVKACGGSLVDQPRLVAASKLKLVAAAEQQTERLSLVHALPDQCFQPLAVVGHAALLLSVDA